MSKVVHEVVTANEAYAKNFGARGELALPPARGFAILTCMDARLDPAKYAGLAEGDAHVIRNAGGRATDDAIRSLVISHKLLGTANGSSSTIPIAAWSFSPTRSSPTCSRMISRPPRSTAGSGRTRISHGGHAAGHFIKWHTIKDQEASVAPGRAAHPRASARAREHPDLRLYLRCEDRTAE